MPIVKEVTGDLLIGFKTIAHGCNCQGVMGSGIARFIRARWPEVYDSYLDKFETEGLMLGSIQPVKTKDSVTVINCMTQDDFGTHARMLNYEALAVCLEEINNQFKGMEVGFPQIGCGLAGGNWEVVKTMIHHLLPDVNAVIVYYG